MARVLMIDNYDSFTYNLVQLLRELGAAVDVRRNDRVTPAEARSFPCTHLVVSPGPGTARDAGESMAVIDALSPHIPVLGVCLGHQAIAEVFGARIDRAPALMHGKSSVVRHDGDGLFAGVPGSFPAGRYHSLSIVEATLPTCLAVTARADDGQIMAVRHRARPTVGVQFHPESVLTPDGRRMLDNFLSLPPPSNGATS